MLSDFSNLVSMLGMNRHALISVIWQEMGCDLVQNDYVCSHMLADVCVILVSTGPYTLSTSG